MDEKITKALRLFAEGIDRHEASKRLGYKNYKVLDMYFRRRNYRWSAKHGTYVPSIPGDEEDATPPAVLSKPQQIISLLFLPNKDPREVARQVGFKDIQQMADYMTKRGFSWDSNSRNYVRDTGISEIEPVSDDDGGTPPLLSAVSEHVNNRDTSHGEPGCADENRMAQYLPLLDLLDKNKERLIDLITIKQESKIPRYTLPGACTAKSLQMPIVLDRLIKDFACERNITQKDLLTVAIIEFLTKYGFDIEVEYMLNSGRC